MQFPLVIICVKGIIWIVFYIYMYLPRTVNLVPSPKIAWLVPKHSMQLTDKITSTA